MTFVEQLVQKKKAGREWGIIAAIMGGVVLLSLAAVVLVLWLAASMGQAPMSFLMVLLLIIAALIFGGVWLGKTQYIEFEYSVYEGGLDIDQITAKRRRKRIVQVTASRIDSLEPCTDALRSRPFDRVVMAAPSPEEATWGVTYHSKKNGNTLVLFAPNARTLDALGEGMLPIKRREFEQKRREAGL